MKSVIKFIYLTLLYTALSSTTVFAQQGVLVAKDYRIAKFEKDIIMFLIKEKQVLDTKTPFNVEDYKVQIMAWKCVEIFSNDTTKNLLLIGFSTSADHGDKFWGILTAKEKYFFYDLKDMEYLTFKKKYDSDKVAIITLYYNQHLPAKHIVY